MGKRTQSNPSVTQLSEREISVFMDRQIRELLKCSTFGAGVLVSQSSANPPPSVGAVVGVPQAYCGLRGHWSAAAAWYPTDYF